MPFQEPIPAPTAAATGSGRSILLTLAAIVVIAAGVREAAGIITPILAAAFISMIAILPLTLLQGKLGVPRWLALLIVLLLTMGGALGLGYYLSQSAASIKPLLPEYERRIDELLLTGLESLQQRGVDIDPDRLLREAHAWKITDFADVILISMAKVLQNFLFVLLVSAFIIAEASSFPTKMRVAFPHAMQSSGLGNVADKIRSFLVVITQLNVVLAVINWIACISTAGVSLLLWRWCRASPAFSSAASCSRRCLVRGWDFRHSWCCSRWWCGVTYWESPECSLQFRSPSS